MTTMKNTCNRMDPHRDLDITEFGRRLFACVPPKPKMSIFPEDALARDISRVKLAAYQGAATEATRRLVREAIYRLSELQAFDPDARWLMLEAATMYDNRLASPEYQGDVDTGGLEAARQWVDEAARPWVDSDRVQEAIWLYEMLSSLEPFQSGNAHCA